MSLLKVRVARDSLEWNAIVDKSPYSVLHHRYELCTSSKYDLPLIVEERNHVFLLPLSIMRLFKSFRLATTPIYFFASPLPDAEEAIDLISEALEHLSVFLREMRIDYLSTCAPAFRSLRCADLLKAWFKKHKASVQIIYAHVIPTKNTAFEEIWKHQIEKRTRNRIRKAEKEGLVVINIDTVDSIYTWIDDIYQCNVSALKRQGRWGAYPDSNKGVFLSELVSAKKLLKEYFNIYGAIYNGRLVAYMVIHEYNKLMQVGKAMSHTKFLNKYPNEALLAHIVRKACEHGFEHFVYGWDRVTRDGKIPSLYSSLQRFKFKFGFREVPIPIYRLGLTRRGRIMQHFYSDIEYFITISPYIPKFFREPFSRFYAQRRRRLAPLLHV